MFAVSRSITSSLTILVYSDYQLWAGDGKPDVVTVSEESTEAVVLELSRSNDCSGRIFRAGEDHRLSFQPFVCRLAH